MSADLVRQLAKGNEQYKKNFKGTFSFKEFPEQKGIIILSCLDPRADPKDLWNLTANVAIIRNAGGRAKDALRSMEALASLLSGGLGAIAVIHHADCGLGPNNFHDNHVVQRRLKDRLGAGSDVAAQIDETDFGGFAETQWSC
ncbi:hypothetical protein BAUCODRAFT_20547 [Baudoinia panamericana UAMH 10762]|uniref:Carbonic anhydrase n=1 Tax=Baudoinia panamericana (strain UAMH 10762) TaxID=717646 RepID=M2MU46_BAUPA|nr:uncharacterized protein BAUCODRAFT_20547 [Baudoinia panamericana UAMH 10762]EMD00447.1 hypothetical protein BAUCODRAFT_20547 [Baudoinia panamericana UAMH 10762]